MNSSEENSAHLGSNPNLALQLIYKLYGDGVDVNIIDSGFENLIIIVNKTYVVRFPRTKEVWVRGQTERSVLQELSNTTDLIVPKVVSINNNPPYLVTQYLHGEMLDVQTVRNLPQAKKQHIGQSIADFAFALHSSIPVKMVTLSYIEQKSTYDDYLRRVLMERNDPNAKIDKLAKKYYLAWQKIPKAKTVVVHDDLHTGNLLFDKDYNLSGVLDFGAVCVGSPEQDLRQMYRLGEDVLEAVARRYEQLSGQPFDRQTAKVWTVTQELAAYCREESGTTRDRAKANLEYWFGALS
ncbi:aminoglycoside phosphotransferase family protein [Candidatus Saccharibacteria bacterium]|nr:aminoglycoside phosphotransferase family protein [Candidatus Saccharibacteria bacterium]